MSRIVILRSWLLPVAVMMITLMMCHGASAAFTNDPRCPANFDPLKSCPSSMILPGGVGLDPTRSIDPTTCNDQENCPRCLGDDVWQQKLKDEVGLYAALRDPDFKPWVMVNGWLSHEIISTITMILLREAMNISARGAAQGADGTLIYICCSDAALNMEQWPGGRIPSDPTGTVTQMAGGYTGQSGLFVPPHTLEKYPLAFTYHAYRLVDEYKHIFPPSFSTDCTNMTVDSSAGCTTGNYVCENNLWTNTTCYDGKWYVPPQCNIPGEVGNPNTTNCQEVLHADPTYDDGFFEGVIKNNGFNMTVAYLGLSRYGSHIRELAERKQDFMFYWYEPDPLISAVGAKLITFAENTAACNAVRSTDPTLNGATCGYPVVTLYKKTQSTVLAEHADFKHFFNSFSLTRAQLESVLTQHTSAGGNATVYDASCNWIKNNFDTWKDAVQNTPSAGSTATTTSTTSALSNKGVLAALIVVPVLFIIAIVAFVTWTCCRHQLALKNAPQTAPLAIVFTDIESSTMLWETCGDDMGLAVEIHHAIIRKHIEEFGAYEVKTIGDSFMIACSSLGDATLMCLAIQTSLGECRDFPPRLQFNRRHQSICDTGMKSVSSTIVILGDNDNELMGSISTPNGSPSHSSIQQAATFNYPLRVRIGLHWCQDVNPRIDKTHGRYDYYGHDVNVCARVEAQASGGQILLTSETLATLLETDEYSLLIAPDTVTSVFQTDVELKGVSDTVVLHVIAPRSQVLSGYVKAPKGMRDGHGSRGMTSKSSWDDGSASSTLSGGGPAFRSKSDVSAVSGCAELSPSEAGNASLSRHVTSSVNYSTALLRASYKAVPESVRTAWLTALAKSLRIKLKEGGDDDKHGQTARFEELRAGVRENCTQSLTATHSVEEESGNMSSSSTQSTQLPHLVISSPQGNTPQN